MPEHTWTSLDMFEHVCSQSALNFLLSIFCSQCFALNFFCSQFFAPNFLLPIFCSQFALNLLSICSQFALNLLSICSQFALTLYRSKLLWREPNVTHILLRKQTSRLIRICVAQDMLVRGEKARRCRSERGTNMFRSAQSA